MPGAVTILRNEAVVDDMNRFRTTRWSLVMGARSGSVSAGRALDELCRIYRPPVLAFIRRHGRSEAEAEDLTQGFFEQLLRLRAHAKADPERGRFRVFLLVAVKRFLSNQLDHAHAAKRGGGVPTLELEENDSAADPDTPDAVFERSWAATVLRQAALRLQEEADAAGKQVLFRALRPFLLEAPEADQYAQLATELGLRRNTLAVAIHRLRQRLRELVREELAETVSEPDELEAEVEVLQRAMAAPRA